MVAAITDGIKVSVETEYLSDYSNPRKGEYQFGYKVTIENLSASPMKLLRRICEIFDSEGSYSEVDGPGVAGAQPIIESGETFWYFSGCTLYSDMGRMNGNFIFENLITRQLHHIEIPTFDLVAPFKNN